MQIASAEFLFDWLEVSLRAEDFKAHHNYF
jgi:hypothetical protein